MEKVAKEFFRALKPEKFCAILMGDTRRNKIYQPLAYKVMNKFLNVGFLLKEDIIKDNLIAKPQVFGLKNQKNQIFCL